ncbi:MAG: BamA/TamA family outer membrane protein [Melioribacteraceae bacterium]|nr:BamA/TamA family outer membrane protein [Melioribacteraceae bacterium]
MIHQIIKVVLIFFALALITHAQSINSIKISGGYDFSESDYLSWIEIGEGAVQFTGINDSIRMRIGRNLTDYGYFHFSIDSIASVFSADSQKIDLTVIIDEGEPTYINNIYLSGLESSDSSFVLSSIEFLEGSVLNKYEIESSIFEILEEFENKTYPFASVVFESITFVPGKDDTTNHFADLYLKIDKGPPSRIEEIEIVGNDKTKDYVIIRNIRIEENEEYSQKRLEEIPQRLNKLRFFEPVELPDFYFNSEGKGVLRIKVKEKQTNNFDGIVGYIPSNIEGESGYFTGFVDVSLRNLFGTERGAAFKWEKLDRESQFLQIKYLEPWLLGMPFNIRGEFQQRKQDTTYVERYFTGKIDYLATEKLSASLIFSSGSVIPSESVNQNFTVYNSSIITSGVNLRYDSGDDFYLPTKGLITEAEFTYSSKKIKGPAKFITSTTKTNIDLLRIAVNIDFFLEIFRRNIIAFGISGRELTGDFFEESDLFRLGGTNSLRGYREDQFRGNRVFWSNLEYRLALSSRTYTFLFFDSGYYLRSENSDLGIEKIESFKIGYGLGINLETALGVLGVSYALGSGDAVNEGKIHFGLINEF